MTARGDLRDALAYVFRREGGDPIPAEELENRVSFDLRWFSPGEARAFVERVRGADLVEETSEGLVPTFEADAVDLPVTYEPSMDLDPVDAEPEGGDEAGGGGDVVARVAEALAEATEWTRSEAEREIAAERERLGDLVSDEAAALMVARDRGLDLDPWLEEAGEAARRRLADAG